jgi:hypothetical protein
LEHTGKQAKIKMYFGLNITPSSTCSCEIGRTFKIAMDFLHGTKVK